MEAYVRTRLRFCVVKPYWSSARTVFSQKIPAQYSCTLAYMPCCLDVNFVGQVRYSELFMGKTLY